VAWGKTARAIRWANTVDFSFPLISDKPVKTSSSLTAYRTSNRSSPSLRLSGVGCLPPPSSIPAARLLIVWLTRCRCVSSTVSLPLHLTSYTTTCSTSTPPPAFFDPAMNPVVCCIYLYRLVRELEKVNGSSRTLRTARQTQFLTLSASSNPPMPPRVALVPLDDCAEENSPWSSRGTRNFSIARRHSTSATATAVARSLFTSTPTLPARSSRIAIGGSRPGSQGLAQSSDHKVALRGSESFLGPAIADR